MARIAVLRRRVDKPAQPVLHTLGIGSLKLAMDECIALVSGMEVSLTKIEFELLFYLTKKSVVKKKGVKSGLANKKRSKKILLMFSLVT